MAQTVPADTHMPDETALAEVRRHVADYNARRMATFRRAVTLIVISIVGAIALVAALFAWAGGGVVLIIGLIATFFLGWLGVTFAWKPVLELQSGLRAQVFPQLFGFVDRLSYSSGWDPGVLKVVERLHLEIFNNSHIDDTVTGVHDGLQFQLLEATLSRKSGKKQRIVFRGLIFHFVIDRDYPGTLVVARRNAGDWLAGIIEHFFPGTDSNVMLRDDYLDRTYAVRTDNPTAAESMAGTSLAPALRYLGEEFGANDVRLALQRRECVVMLPSTRNYFAMPAIWEELHYEAHVRSMIHEMVMLLAVAQLMRML